MTREFDPWRLRGEPESSHLSGREREIARRVAETMRDWVDENLERLEGEQQERIDGKLRDLRDEVELLIREETSWERDLETKLRAIQSFELEFGSTRTGEETRAMFRDVRAHLAKREARWERIRDQLDRLGESRC